MESTIDLPITTTDEPSDDIGGKYLTFALAGETYGLAILKVREIICVMEIASVPQTHDFVEGVMNLRGRIVPVIDLRLKFGLEPASRTEETCIIVVDVGMMMGIIVDMVDEVHDIPEEDIDSPPSLGGAVDTSFVLGMGKVKDEIKILLDIDMVLLSSDLVMPLELAAG